MLQAQVQCEEQRAKVTSLSQKLAEDVAMTEELQEELTALENNFTVMEQNCAGQAWHQCLVRA